MGTGRLEDVLLDRIADVAEQHALPDACRHALRAVVEETRREYPFSVEPFTWGEAEDGTDGPSERSLSLEPPAGSDSDVREARRSRGGRSGAPSGRLARYEDLGVIGAGGMGEVRRVLDRDLNRTMAMKIMRPSWAGDQAALARFIEEAQATAQLQHPGIVPVHELGRLADGRYYFTMKEVRGKTLRDVIQEVHAASDGGHWEAAPSGWTLRRLIEAFRKVCEAVGYAHSRGVVHRDLKPANVMVGDFGEVLVMDWGLARVRARGSHAAAPQADAEEIVTHRSQRTEPLTMAGAVAGTPAYMPPEQARGLTDQLGPTADVYSLGAILYEILSGRPPYEGHDPVLVLAQVLTGPPLPPRRRSVVTTGGQTLTADFTLDLEDEPFAPPPEPVTLIEGPAPPDELTGICHKAMAREPGDRFPDAGALALEVSAWLDGAQRREQALKVVAEAEAILPEVVALRAQAAVLQREAAERLEGVKPFDPIEQKRPGWRTEDDARRLERQADLEEVRYVQRLQGSLTHFPDLPEAHEKLADLYQQKHAAAELARDARSAAQLEVLLRAHDRGRHAAYLKGDGAVTLVTEPPGAAVELFRYVEEDRRFALQRLARPGRTPLEAVTLPMGSYLLKVHAEGRRPLQYPVCIARQEHWDGRRPGEDRPYPIYLPSTDELGPDDIYVPAGFFRCGGDPEAFNALPLRRLWCDAFVMRRFPVTNREYLAFLNDLLEHGMEDHAMRWVPRTKGGPRGEEGKPIYGRGPDGRFVLAPDGDGDIWLPDWPVVQVTWHCAEAYARWEAARSGRAWRLPGELEREKAARGVDGRFFPWGDFGDPLWACTLDSHTGRSMPAVVQEFPADRSPYGIGGLGGNVREWCRDAYRREGPPARDGRLLDTDVSSDPDATRVIRGGSWMTRMDKNSRSASRYWDVPGLRSAIVSFRIARTIRAGQP